MYILSAYVIVHRTQSNQTPNAIQSDTERNPIGRRTQSNQTADANGRGCSCLSCTNQANRAIYSSYLSSALPLARARAVPTKPTEQFIPECRGCSCLSCTNKANRTIYSRMVGGAAVSAAPTKPTELSFHEPQPNPRPARYHAPRSHEQPIPPVDGHYLLAAFHRTHDVRRHVLR